MSWDMTYKKQDSQFIEIILNKSFQRDLWRVKDYDSEYILHKVLDWRFVESTNYAA